VPISFAGNRLESLSDCVKIELMIHGALKLFRPLSLICCLLAAIDYSVVSCAASTTEVAVTITPDVAATGHPISPDFCGLSFETKMLLPDDGKYFFRADNAELISLFKSLGVKSLRIGGNTADYAYVPIPSESDVDQLCAFAKAAGVKVIYNLRLKDQTDPAADVKLAKYLMDHYRPQIACFTIGNEPNMYFREYKDYRTQWRHFAEAILAAVPEAQFNGPSTTPGKTAWAKEFATDFADWPHLYLVTQHSYPGGDAQKIPDAATARAHILSPEIVHSYQKFYDKFVPAVLEHHERYRLEEANSLFHGGATGVSNSFASALWALDYMHWWAAHQASGINFHTGNRHAADENHVPGGYDISYSTPSGLKLHPIAYALKAFSFSSEGRCVPVSVSPESKRINLTAYAVAANDNSLVMTIINKELFADGPTAQVTFGVDKSYSTGQMLLLKSPSGDVAATSGMTLGDAPIAGDGTWNGTWTDIPYSSGKFAISVSAATAAIVRLTRQ
jgi:hypothetical protein